MQLSPYGLLLLTQPLQSSEQHIRANLELPSNFVNDVAILKSSERCAIVKCSTSTMSPAHTVLSV